MSWLSVVGVGVLTALAGLVGSVLLRLVGDVVLLRLATAGAVGRVRVQIVVALVESGLVSAPTRWWVRRRMGGG